MELLIGGLLIIAVVAIGLVGLILILVDYGDDDRYPPYPDDENV